MSHHYMEGTGQPRKPECCLNCGSTEWKFYDAGLCPDCNPLFPEYLKVPLSEIQESRKILNVPCKNFKKYKGIRPPKCKCRPCHFKYELVQWEKKCSQNKRRVRWSELEDNSLPIKFTDEVHQEKYQ